MQSLVGKHNNCAAAIIYIEPVVSKSLNSFNLWFITNKLQKSCNIDLIENRFTVKTNHVCTFHKFRTDLSTTIQIVCEYYFVNAHAIIFVRIH